MFMKLLIKHFSSFYLLSLQNSGEYFTVSDTIHFGLHASVPESCCNGQQGSRAGPGLL